jgi:hypothetical protein
MSTNHQFYAFSDDVVERWVKTPVHMVSGKRLNPYNPTEQIDWALRTRRENFNYDRYSQREHPDKASKVTFDYEDEVLELYSEVEAKLFRRLNRVLIERGLLKPYKGSARDTDETNIMSDEQVDEFAKTKSFAQFRKRVSEITSPTTLDRLYVAVKAHNRPISFLTVLEDRKNGING